MLAPDDGTTPEAEITRIRAGKRKRSRRPGARRRRGRRCPWRQELAWSALSVDSQRILTALADRVRLLKAR
ncbi:hypothetical protein [Streptomyces sparsogenes]|uniref:hypothetical protein n=1 Tax=Streptomyces sparsogenes TaxID=67365 RepID=UPI003F4D4B71